jgi:uncharacterized membrane protein
MILDHVRTFLHASEYAYDPLDPGQTTTLVYLTRWVTHLCAPTFVFLAGVSIWIQLARGKGRRELSTFLLSRGGWLILMEVTVVSFALAFEVPYVMLLQVIWAIGWSMVALAALIWLSRWAVLALGITIIAGHDTLDAIKPDQWGVYADLWIVLHSGGRLMHDGSLLALVVYPVLPWLGVMALGYGVGEVFLKAPLQRDRTLLTLGVGMVLIFFILRSTQAYGDPHLWSVQADLRSTVMLFFNVQKYPPSLLYVCITLGPVLLITPLVERWRGQPARFFRILGSVPMFAYVLHLYLVHALAILLHLIWHQQISSQFNFVAKVFTTPQVAEGTGLPLPLVYVTWLIVIAILYPLCRWYAQIKKRRTDWWLSYF